MKTATFATLAVAATMALISGPHLAASSAGHTAADQKVVVHLSKFTNDLHAPFMALKVAKALQSREASVTIFLDMEGARIANPTEDLEVVVCPHCAHHYGVSEGHIRDGVRFGTEEMIAQLFLDADKVIDY